MKRVAMVIQRYLPHVGGAERQLQQLAPRLRDLGYELHILTRHEKGLARFELIEGVPVHRLPAAGPKMLAAATFTRSAVWKLIHLRPDIIHAHEILTPASIAILAKRILMRPVLVKLLRGGARGDIYKIKRRPFWKSDMRRLIRDVDAFLVISREIDQELAALDVPPEKRVFLPNGVDTVRCTPASEERKQKLRASLSLPQQAKIVLYAGRLVPEKRVDHLLMIWPEVRTRFPAAHLLILGEGAERDRLMEMNVDGAQFTGQVQEAVPYLQAADLFVLPSSTEGLSNSILEAMSCGLPVLATTVGGAPDVIQHKVSGWLIPPEDVDALQSGLETLLDDEALCFNLGSHARERILSHFSLDSVAKRLAVLYQQLLVKE
ncbi:MAG: glycosyltransferase family 4 protein [Bacteroidota bacterium]